MSLTKHGSVNENVNEFTSHFLGEIKYLRKELRAKTFLSKH